MPAGRAVQGLGFRVAAQPGGSRLVLLLADRRAFPAFAGLAGMVSGLFGFPRIGVFRRGRLAAVAFAVRGVTGLGGYVAAQGHLLLARTHAPDRLLQA